MNVLNWNTIKNTLTDKPALGLKLLFIFTVAYLVMTGGDHRSLKVFLLTAALLLIVFFVKKITQPFLWYVFLAILLSDLACDYFVRANHHFFLIYLTILIIIYLHNSRLHNLLVNIKFIVVIVLLFSAIQKLISPQFLSGDFYYYMMNMGSFFKPILYFSHEMKDIILSNKHQIVELAKTDPNEFDSITLQNILPNLDVISQTLAWMTILLEFLSAILLLWKPKHLLTHLVFILLITGIFFTRFENGFLALLAISGVWMSESVRIRAVYAILVIVSLAFMMTRIGFY